MTNSCHDKKESFMNSTKANTILFRINRYRNQTGTFYRVQATIPGFGPAYLVKPEGDYNFPNRNAALKACKRRAATLGFLPKIVSPVSTRSTTTV